MSLRLKLLLLGLATLVLPWGGCQYAREMESALREGEENSLQAVSQTIAASLQGRTDLLYREAPPPADAPEAPPDERSEEHTSELQSQSNLVCRLLLEKNRRIRRLGLHSPAC